MSQARGKRPREEALSIPPKQYVKLLPRSRKSRGFEFTVGENTNTQPLREDAHCGPGLHIAHFCDIHYWLRLFQPDEAIEMALVDVPDGEPLVQYTRKAKAHRIVLRAPQPVPYEVYLRGIRMNFISLDYVPNYLRTDELLDTALEARASNLARVYHGNGDDRTIGLNSHEAGCANAQCTHHPTKQYRGNAFLHVWQGCGSHATLVKLTTSAAVRAQPVQAMASAMTIPKF